MPPMTLTPDIVNAFFEGAGSVFTWLSVWRVYTDKGYAGIYLPAIVFFFSWGLWNLYFYPSVDAMWSFYGGISICVANLAWVGSMLYYGPVQRRDW